ncbi:MAG: phenylalanine--tRNA ligase subunit beta [Deltaproteobacteria bacterium]|jgi:phenylalanyl-tRNA synthetase beta chain|nr:phenylalanine--tRNA ligase subunit beta [Deltaproteobacteria bacterium]
MLLSINWLREFVPYEGTAEDLGARLTMLGLELEELKHPFAELEKMLVGYIAECDPHPDSDHLTVCRVDVGSETLNIVCGAPNVAKGQYVVVAPVGSSLPGGLAVKKARLRGQESNGIICSERELGLSDDHSGILVLNEALAGPFTPGKKAVDVMGLDTEVLELGVTPNRGDCLSIYGLAREVAVAYNLPLTLPKLDYSGVAANSRALETLRVEVENGDICPVYRLRAIEDLKVGPSPARLRWRLQAMGQRAISNLVDVTNYIMLELGQPLHSFDYHKVRGGVVRVAMAREGEKLVTLDGQERALTPRDITIRDAEGAIGIGGVMGALNSEIDSGSRAVLLEGAVFGPSYIRHTAKRLHLPSEAAYRFERCVDQGMNAYALERAALLIAKLGQGRVSAGCLELELKPWQGPLLPLRLARVEKLIGVPFKPEFCVRTLEKLGCGLKADPNAAKVDKAEGKEVWQVTAPSHRPDLEREVDLIEEVARVYGFENLPETLPMANRPLALAGQPESRFQFVDRVKGWAAGLGLNEVITFSFVGHKELDFLGAPEEGRIYLANPLTSELDALRSYLAPGLLNILRNNLAKGVNDLRIFEFANRFNKDPQSETTASEVMHLGLLLHGERFSTPWPQLAAEADYQDLKGLVEALCAKLGLGAPEFKKSEPALPWLAPGVDLHICGRPAGYLGRVKADLADAYHALRPVWLAEINMDLLYDLHRQVKVNHKPLPVYPPVRRDITVMAPRGLMAEEIMAVIRQSSPPVLENVSMVDLFEPENSSERNLTFRLTYRSAERTLKDAEVDKFREQVAENLTQALPVRV